MDSAVVKSVGRVFEVLEFFDGAQEPLTATQVGRHLSYPQSSTLALLKSMVKLGYLAFDRNEHTYFPTMRVALLGQWLENALYGEGHLFTLMEEVHQATGETVALSCQNDLAMQFMQIRTGAKAFSLNIRSGALAPLFHSTIGLVALADKSDQDIAKLAERYNRKVRPPEPKADLPAVLQRVRKIRRAGFAVGYGMYVPSVGAIAWALPPRVGKRGVVLAVSAPSERMRTEEAEIIRIVRAAVKRHSAK